MGTNPRELSDPQIRYEDLAQPHSRKLGLEAELRFFSGNRVIIPSLHGP
jgi:hypothetical protein